MLAGKTLLDYANLFSDNDFEKNEKEDISHKEFLSINYVLTEYNQTQKRNQKSWNIFGTYYIKYG